MSVVVTKRSSVSPGGMSVPSPLPSISLNAPPSHFSIRLPASGGSFGHRASSFRIAPFVSQRSRSPSCGASSAIAFARQTPLMPPAEVPEMMSMTTRVWNPSRAALRRSALK